MSWRRRETEACRFLTIRVDKTSRSAQGSIMKRLIVNADGFGFGSGATQGILDVLQKGSFVTSVSVNANFPEAERIREVARNDPQISIGVHLNPMVGKPCLPPSEVPSLVGPEGTFHENKFPYLLKRGIISIPELERELDAQIAKIKGLVGDRLTHLDSQANSHLLFFDLFVKVAQKWNIRRIRNNASLICMEAPNPLLSRSATYFRLPHVWIAHQYRKYQMQRARRKGLRMADALITVGYAGTGNKTNPENWRRILRNCPHGSFEIYCHPAYPDNTLRRWAVYCEERREELELLSQPWLIDEARRAEVALIGFHDI